MTTVFYSYISKNNVGVLEKSLLLFPEFIRKAIEKYNLQNDRNARIISKLLLIKGLSDFFPDQKIDLHFLETNGKPIYKNLPIHFSSTHSQDLVAVAFSTTQEIGIDMEFKKNIDTTIFTDFLHVNEQKSVEKSKNEASLFYSLWTKKEALVKTLGTGIDTDFTSIDCLKSETNYNGTKYFFKEISLDINYSCFVSGKEKIITLDYKEIIF